MLSVAVLLSLVLSGRCLRAHAVQHLDFTKIVIQYTISGADPGLFRKGWLGALAIHSFDIPLNIDNICEAFKRKHPRKMCGPSIRYD